MIKRIMSALLAVAMLVSLAAVMPSLPDAVNPLETASAAVNTEGRATVNEDTLQIVPAPGEVVIDGIIGDDEWDWSGRLIGYNDYDFKDIYYVEVAAMWDKENLYMGFKFIDDDPMLTLYDPILEPSWTWRGDSIQLRTITDRSRGWWTISYYDKKDMASLYLTYPDEDDTVGYVTEPGGTKLINTSAIGGSPQNMNFDAEVKYRKWDDGGGYNVELKIPFQMMYLSTYGVGANTTFNLGIECYWGDPKGESNNEYSIFLQGGGYTNTMGWKPAELLAEGNVTLREYIHDAENTSPGTIPLRVKVPKHAKKITLVVEDKKGTRIANAVNEWDVTEDCIVGEEGDNYIVETLWNGTDMQGYMVAPGEYVVKGICHDGIVPYFDEAAYNPGNPPWPSSSGNGSWASDHHPPVAITSIGDKIYIGSSNCESGTGIFMTDNEGKKIWGIKRGAERLTSNDKYVLSLPGNDFYADTTKGDAYLMRLDAETGSFRPFTLNGEQREMQLMLSTILGLNPNGVIPEQVGLAANNDYILIATAKDNKKAQQDIGIVNFGSYINVLDAESAVLLKKIAVDDVGEVAAGKDGMFYAIANGGVIEVNPQTGKVTQLPVKEEQGEEFKEIAVDNDGNFVIFEKTDRQLKIYSKTGEKLYEIGKKGGRALEGYWDEGGFTHQVSSLTVDSKGQIWVVEEWNYPRRISVWNKDGLVKDFIGNPGYMGAGGALHNDDAEKVYCGANEMIMDRETHTYKMNRVLYVPDLSKGECFELGVTDNVKVTHFRSDASGEMRNYIYKPSGGQGSVLYVENEDGSFRPFWATGLVSDIGNGFGYGKYIPSYDSMVYRPDESYDPSDVFKHFKAISGDTQYMWNDWDNDGAFEYDECEFWHTNYYKATAMAGWGGTITSDFKMAVTSRESDVSPRTPRQLYILSPDYFRDDGLPVYTFNSFDYVDTETFPFNGDNILTEGGTIISVRDLDGNSDIGYYSGIKCIDPETGEDLWWYNNQYAGVHGSHGSPIQQPGMVVGPIKVLGTVPTASGKEVFALRGNMGNDFLFTTDGYYVQTLFRDGRIPMLRLPDTYEEALGLDMSKFSENGEPFSGTMVRHSDGKVRLLSSTAGPTIIIVRVEGFDTIQDIEPINITLTPEMLTEAYIFNNTDPEALVFGNEESSNGYGIARTTKEITINGETSDWIGLGSDLAISKDGIEENGTARLAYDDENLYALYVINDKSPMVNMGNEYQKLFKTGDLCDIMLSNTNNSSGTTGEGDIRITLSEFEGKPVAVLTKWKTDGEKQPYRYASPVNTLDFDYVGLIDDAEVSIVKDAENGLYILEAKLPLASIGIKAEANKNITGDVGIITSDEVGNANKARIYHFNKDTGLVSDVPGEAVYYPSQWGKMYFMAE